MYVHPSYLLFNEESTVIERASQEKEIFDEPKWREVVSPRRCGIALLKTRLINFLTKISRKEFQNVRMYVETNYRGMSLQAHVRALKGFTLYRFPLINQGTLNEHFDGAIFTEVLSLKLITHVTEISTACK